MILLLEYMDILWNHGRGCGWLSHFQVEGGGGWLLWCFNQPAACSKEKEFETMCSLTSTHTKALRGRASGTAPATLRHFVSWEKGCRKPRLGQWSEEESPLDRGQKELLLESNWVGPTPQSWGLLSSQAVFHCGLIVQSGGTVGRIH